MSSNNCFHDLQHLLKQHPDDLYKMPLVTTSPTESMGIKEIYLIRSFNSESVTLRRFVSIKEIDTIENLLKEFNPTQRNKIYTAISLLFGPIDSDINMSWAVREIDPITIETHTLFTRFDIIDLNEIPCSFSDYIIRKFYTNGGSRRENLFMNPDIEIIDTTAEQPITQARLDLIFPKSFKEEAYLRNINNRPRIFKKSGEEIIYGFKAVYLRQEDKLSIEFGRCWFKMCRTNSIVETIFLLENDTLFDNVDFIIKIFYKINALIMKEKELKEETSLLLKDIFNSFNKFY